MTQFDPKSIFGPRVGNYILYRPGYPASLLEPLRSICGLSSSWRVADIGSGTGLLARLFLDLGCVVFGVESNEEMRMAGDQILAGYSHFSSAPGSAEATGLQESSVELVCAGMAFHWFDIPRARSEFQRILTSGGWVVLVWNRMLPGPDPFMQAYTDLLLEYCPGWTETRRRDQPGNSLNLPGFFGGDYRRETFPNQQLFGWQGLVGRTLSIAHAPQPGESNFENMHSRLKEILDRFQLDNQIVLLYETELFFGRLL